MTLELPRSEAGTPDFVHIERIVSDPKAIIYVRDDSGRYVWVNDAYGKYLPHSREQVIGKTNRELHGEEASRTWEAADSLSMAADTFVVTPEQMFDERSRNWRKFVSTKIPIRAGGQRYLVGVSIEILDDNVIEYERRLGQVRARLIEQMRVEDA